jgi:hypothetical protein
MKVETSKTHRILSAEELYAGQHVQTAESIYGVPVVGASLIINAVYSERGIIEGTEINRGIPLTIVLRDYDIPPKGPPPRYTLVTPTQE